MIGNYSLEAMKEISRGRTTKATKIIQKCGGRILSGYATMGKTDLLVITEFPSVEEAMKASVNLTNAMGISFSTMPALSLEAFDKLVGNKS
jgi:uncharacterized protein with GYD domain